MTKYNEPSKCPDLTGLVFLENKQSTYWKVCGKADKGWSGCIYPLIKCNKNGKEYTHRTRFYVEGLIELSKMNDGETYNLHGCNYTKVGQAKSNEKITLKNPELTAIRMSIANSKNKIEKLECELKYENERLRSYEEEMIKLMGCEELI